MGKQKQPCTFIILCTHLARKKSIRGTGKNFTYSNKREVQKSSMNNRARRCEHQHCPCNLKEKQSNRRTEGTFCLLEGIICVLHSLESLILFLFPVKLIVQNSKCDESSEFRDPRFYFLDTTCETNDHPFRRTWWVKTYLLVRNIGIGHRTLGGLLIVICYIQLYE